MEPVTILGVAGNVVQFVDFAGKLVSATRTIHRSGSLLEHKDLVLVGEDLSSLSENIKQELTQHNSPQTANDEALRDICESCLEIGTEIQSALKVASDKILEVDVPRHAQYIEGLTSSFATKIVAWAEEQKVQHGVNATVANLSYVMRAHAAREKMMGKR